tara:strand:- start:237 stop:470 length:234 start_codon:yes stop_codon:yes gene_type:complete
MNSEKIYTVALAGANRMNIINASNGTIYHSFTFQGALQTGPVVAGDKCTYVVELLNGEKRGFIRKLPQGVVVASFKV